MTITVITTAALAVGVAEFSLRDTVEDNLLDRSAVVAEALAVSQDVEQAAAVVSRRVAPSRATNLDPNVKNARSLLAQMVASDQELDYLYLGVWSSSGTVLDIAWEPLNAAPNALNLAEDSERLEFIKRATQGRLRRSDGRVHELANLYGDGEPDAPRVFVVMGLDPSLQLSRYRSALLLAYALSGLILFASLFLFFRRLERRFEALRDYSTKLEAGQLDAPAPALGTDEIGELTHALARLSTGLGGSISNVRSATRGLDELSGSVRDASRKIAGDAGTQSLSLESTSRAMTQLAEGSGEVDRTLSNLIESAERSHREMSEVASEVRAIANIVEELAAAVHQSQVGFGATERNLQQAESAIRMLTSTAESTAASMNQMAASIASVEDGTENASRRATATATSAAMGAHIGRETVAAVSEIERNTEA
ncbi:MAG: methyl-accepting chemotaxis protein, partial [Myxococcota bacterium]